MEHKYINEFNLVERFLTGRLAAEETAEFAEHFVVCAECLDRLETTKAFIEGLRTMVNEQVPEPHRRHSREPLRHLGLAIPRKPFAVAAVALLLIALVSVIVVALRINRTQVEADQAKSAAAQWQTRYEEEHQSSSLTERRHLESERELTEQVTQLRIELEKRTQGPTEMPDWSGGSIKPQINLGIFALNSVRGSEQSPDSINEFTLPRSSATFVIAVRVEPESGYKHYRLTIVDDDKRLVWRGRGMPDRQNVLSVTFNSSFFRRRDYRLTVEGVAGNDSTSVVGEYSFRLLRAD